MSIPHTRFVLSMVLVLVGGLVPVAAHAFCGFFVSEARGGLANNASQVALVRTGSSTVMAMSNNYQGPPEDFAMVVPVPVVLHKEQVKTLPIEILRHLDYITAPRLVEYWEQDPCAPHSDGYDLKKNNGLSAQAVLASRIGVLRDLGVKVEARFIVGEYEVLILSAKESDGLEQWLRQHKYNLPEGASAALAPYVRDQMKFFVARVDIKRVRRDAHGLVVLSPLRFSFESPELRLPVRLGLLNAQGPQDLLIYILHPRSRFEVANHPNVFIPTNLVVADAVRDRFAAFYADLFDETLKRSPPGTVVSEYSWSGGWCDPCPVPSLDRSELLLLGLTDAQAGPQGFVVSRLHARYDRQGLGDDLVFREAPAAVGGRGGGEDGPSEARIEPAGTNNFQARYLIRHPFKGAIQCDQPRYGIWGGHTEKDPAPSVARDLAHTPRGTVSLQTSVLSPVPRLGLPGHAPAPRPGEQRR